MKLTPKKGFVFLKMIGKAPGIKYKREVYYTSSKKKRFCRKKKMVKKPCYSEILPCARLFIVLSVGEGVDDVSPGDKVVAERDGADLWLGREEGKKRAFYAVMMYTSLWAILSPDV